MAVTHLADTSVLTRLRSSSVRSVVESLAHGGGVARAGITDLELGYSARDEDEWDEIRRSLDAFTLIETDKSHLRRAGEVQRMLAARHQPGRKVPDLLVAAAAEVEGLTVLHYDADFDRIAAFTGQRCQWVAPAGSVD